MSCCTRSSRSGGARLRGWAGRPSRRPARTRPTPGRCRARRARPAAAPRGRRRPRKPAARAGR